MEPDPVGISPSSADLVLTGEGDYARWGSRIGLGDFDGDFMTDLLVFRSQGTIESAGGARVVTGGSLPAAGTVPLASAGIGLNAWVYRNQGGQFAVGDMDGDGYEDILGRPSYSSSTSTYSDAMWAGGASPPAGDADLDPTLSAYFYNPNTTRTLDFNGDGYDDVAIAKPSAVTLWLGTPSLGTPGVMTIFRNAPVTPNLDSTIAVGDVDQDGYDDILLKVGSVAGHVEGAGNWQLVLGSASPPANVDADSDAVMLVTGEFVSTSLDICWIGPDFDAGGFPDITCYSDATQNLYIHLVEDTDNDGDLWSVMDCDADDNDPLVQ